MAEAIVLPLDFAERLVTAQPPSVVSFYVGGLVHSILNHTRGFLPAASSRDLARVPDHRRAAAQACAARLLEERSGGLEIVDFDQRTDAWLRLAIQAERRRARSKRAADARWGNEKRQLSLENGGLAVVEQSANSPPDPEHAPSICSPPQTPPREETGLGSYRSARRTAKRSASSRDGGPGEGKRHPVDDYIDRLHRTMAEESA